jgi:hypothetical protein
MEIEMKAAIYEIANVFATMAAIGFIFVVCAALN